MQTKNDSLELAGAVQALRIRVATAESKVKLLRDQARQAKRRRKEAKRSAQRARKQFKRFKAELAELRQALAKAETKLQQAGGRTQAGKLTKIAAAVKHDGLRSKKPKSVARKPRRTLARSPRVTARVTRKKPAITETKAAPEGPADVAALDPTPSTPEIISPNT